MRVFLTVSQSLFIGAAACAFALGCAQGSGERLHEFPDLAKIDEWDAPEPGYAPKGSPVEKHGWLRVEGLNLVDASGEPVQLRGVSSMWLHWDTRNLATNLDGMQWMRDNWKISLFRGAMGVEQGGYLTSRMTMLSKMRRIIQNSIDSGLYVLVDWHAHKAHLSVEEAKEFFQLITEEFGEYPNLIYETFNEPDDPRNITWSEVIKPYHEAVLPVIRERAPKSVVILGTPQWSQLVNHAAKDPVKADNIMYALHFYSCTHTGWLRDIADEALSLGAPLFVTEWGATTADGGVESKEVCSDDGLLWHEWMNKNNISWAAWKLDSCADASCFFSGNVSSSGGWSSNLAGHGPFVVERLLAE